MAIIELFGVVPRVPMPLVVRDRRAKGRGGYTLLEMLLVLAVFLAFAGAVYPAFERVYQDLTLRQAAQKLQTELGRTRTHAVDLGLVHEFRFEPGGSRYLCAPSRPEGEGDEPSSARSLPQDIVFALVDKDEQTIGGAAVDMDGASGADGWSTPTSFYPRGEADAAEFELVDARGQRVRLTIRDLTGSVSVGSIERTSRSGAK